MSCPPPSAFRISCPATGILALVCFQVHGVMFRAPARVLTRRSLCLSRICKAYNSTAAGEKPDAYLVPVDPQAPASALQELNVRSLWEGARADANQGTTRTFFNAHEGASVTLVSLGKNLKTNRDEAVRRATGAGIKSVQDAGGKVVHVDVAGSPHAAGAQVCFARRSTERSVP